jgi:hypothetical protein
MASKNITVENLYFYIKKQKYKTDVKKIDVFEMLKNKNIYTELLVWIKSFIKFY